MSLIYWTSTKAVYFKLHQVQYKDMAIVAITSSSQRNALPYAQAIDRCAETRLVTPGDPPLPPLPAETLLKGVGGLLLAGGPDIDPQVYGDAPDAGLDVSPALDRLELGLLRYALEHDMPVLAICRGMQLLNVAFGGKLLQDIPGHRSEPKDESDGYRRHPIYLSPGSKLAAILGTGGFFRINSMHHQGLREAQKSPRLLASAYSLDDAIIEGTGKPGA